jgi:hypothetical protein
MFKSIYAAAAVVAAVSAPVWAADECGPLPVAPAFLTISDLNAKPVEAARAEVVGSYHHVKTYQGSLRSFRECLQRVTKDDVAALGVAKAKHDDTLAKEIQGRMTDRQAISDKSVDSEQLVVTDFNTLRVAHCTRDTDPKVCPQKKQ